MSCVVPYLVPFSRIVLSYTSLEHIKSWGRREIQACWQFDNSDGCLPRLLRLACIPDSICSRNVDSIPRDYKISTRLYLRTRIKLFLVFGRRAQNSSSQKNLRILNLALNVTLTMSGKHFCRSASLCFFSEMKNWISRIAIQIESRDIS